MVFRRRPWLPLLRAGLGVLLGACVVSWTGSGRHAHLPAAPSAVTRSAPALLQTYCGGCHSNGRAKIDLDGPVDRRTLRQDRSQWDNVLSMLRAEKMPPRRFPQPSARERAHLIHWLEQELAGLAADRGKRLVVRRLRRTEYRNLVRDLTGIDWQPGKDFPEDDAGWDLAPELPALPAAVRARTPGRRRRPCGRDPHRRPWFTSCPRDPARRSDRRGPWVARRLRPSCVPPTAGDW